MQGVETAQKRGREAKGQAAGDTGVRKERSLEANGKGLLHGWLENRWCSRPFVSWIYRNH